MAIAPLKVFRGLQLGDGATTPVSPTGQGRLRYNSSQNRFEQSLNGGAWAALQSAASLLSAAYAAGSSQTDSTISLDSTRLGLRIRDHATPITGGLFGVESSGGTTPYLYVERAYTWIQNAVLTTSHTRTLAIQPGAHTGISAGAELNVLETDPLGPTVWTWSTGALATQRFYRLKPPTIAFSGASVATDVATLYLDPPVAGTNATITTALALWAAGRARIDGRVDIRDDGASKLIVSDTALTSTYLEVASTGFNSSGPFAFGGSVGNGWFFMANTTAATGGATSQVAPELWQQGTAWDGSVSRTIGSRLELLAGATGASYSAQWRLKLDRGAANASPLSAFYDGTTAWIEATNIRPGGTDTLAVTSNVADGGSAVAARVNNTTGLTTAGAKLFAVASAGTDKIFVRANSSTIYDLIFADEGSGIFNSGRTSGVQCFNSTLRLTGGSNASVTGGSSTRTQDLGTGSINWRNVHGAPILNRTQVADADYTQVNGDGYIGYSSLSAARQVTLLAATALTGRIVWVVNETSNTSTITVVSASTINGSVTINAAKGAVNSMRCFLSTGTEWISLTI